MADEDRTPKYFDEAKIREIYSKARTRAQAERHAFERDWFRNLLFYCGIQWIYWNPITRKWIPRILKKWVPRPVTNKFAMHANTMIQVLSAKAPAVTVTPATDSPEDIGAAEVADRNQEVIFKEAGAELARRLCSAWRVFTGNAWIHACYDPDPAHGMSTITQMQCQDCREIFPEDQMTGDQPECPKCKSQNVVPAVDQAGQAVVEEVPRGKLKLEIFSPFEVFHDLEARSDVELDELFARRRYPLEYVRRRWPRDVTDEVQADSGASEGSTGLNLLRAVAYAAATGVTTGYGGGKGASDDQNVTVDFLWKKSCEDFPDGLVAIFANDKLLNKNDLKIPYHDDDGKPRWTWRHVRFDWVPGRMLGKTRLDDLAPLQEERNKMESLFALALKRMAASGWLIPKGCGFVQITGEPGQMIEYGGIDPRQKPEQYQGMGPHPSIVERINQLDADMEQIAGCLVGDTRIPCLDGKTRTMKELAEQFPYGGMWVYGFDREQMRIVPSEVKRAWLTNRDKCVRVCFKEGTHVDCTPDHPFLTWGRGYVRADELKPDEAIVPLDVHRRYGQYLSLVQPVDHSDEMVHRMVAFALLGMERGSASSKLDVHHIDGNPANNMPDNLEVLTRKEHLRRTGPMGFMKNPEAHSPEKQSRKSLKRWHGKSKDERRAEVDAMLSERMKPLAGYTQEEKSAIAKKRWNGTTPEQRRAFVMKHLVANQNPLNHRVESVVPLEGEFDVYDLTTSVMNFGTEAGVFVHNTFDVLKGSAPTGITAGSALRLLLERAVTQFTPAIEDFEKVWAEATEDLILIAKEYWTEARFSKNQGPGKVWEVRQFLGSKISGKVDVVVEAGSAVPKNSVGTQALVQDLGGMGVINPADPETQYQILQEFGMTKLLGSVDDNIRQAQREEWRFFTEGTMPMINPVLDSHPAHVISHRRRALQSDFEEMPDAQQAAWLNHMAEHQMAMMPPPMPAPPEEEGKATEGAPPERKQEAAIPEVPGGVVM